jgi:hypothetical protein
MGQVFVQPSGLRIDCATVTSLAVDTSLQGWLTLGYASSLLSKSGVLPKDGHSRSCVVEVEVRILEVAPPKRSQNSLGGLHRFQAHHRSSSSGVLLISHAAASPDRGGYLTTCFVGAVLPGASWRVPLLRFCRVHPALVPVVRYGC